jgi:ABC-type glycerol-3-phosphate transport system permease component
VRASIGTYPRVDGRVPRWTIVGGFIGIALAVIVPLLFTINTGLRSAADYGTNPLGVATHPTLSALQEVWGRADLPRTALNSAIVSFGSVTAMWLFASAAAYVFVFEPFRGSRGLFALLVASALVPVQAIMYPLFKVLLDLHLTNSYLGMIIAQTAFGIPLTVFAFAAYFRALPRELVDAAKVDGASAVRTLWHVILPMSKPILATTGVINLVWTWNDLLLPLLIMQQPDKQTLTQSLSLIPGQLGIVPGLAAAAALIGMAPLVLLFLVAQRQLVAGITQGAMK